MQNIEEKINLNNTDTKYVIETIDKREMLLYLNASKMALVLSELLSWYKEIYNGKDYSTKILYKGNLYTGNEWLKDYKNIVDKNDLDNHGVVKLGLTKEVYLREDVEHRLNEYLATIRNVINEYMGD